MLSGEQSSFLPFLFSAALPPTPMSLAQRTQTGTAGDLSVCSPARDTACELCAGQCVVECMHGCIYVCTYVYMHTACCVCVCVCVCVFSVLAEAESVGQKYDRSAANRSGIGRLKIWFLLGFKSTHTCEP